MTAMRILTGTMLVLFAPLMQAQPASGIDFIHLDWQLACDNTHTCRAAGYQHADVDLAVSVLLTRAAGPASGVTGEVMIGSYFESDALAALPNEFEIQLRLDGEPVGAVPMDRESLRADMSPQQVAGLLDALARETTIEWLAEGQRWLLSDSGSMAVLLKMDEFQGRLDTPGALVRKGGRDEAGVPPPLPVPVIRTPAQAGPGEDDDVFASTHAGELVAALRATLAEPDDCLLLSETDAPLLRVRMLTDGKRLVSALCAEGSYNAVSGFWVVDVVPMFAAELVTVAGSEYRDGSIHAGIEERGLGDCWSFDRWTWDGDSFAHSAAATTGLCRGIAPGGAWSLPTLTTNIKGPADN